MSDAESLRIGLEVGKVAGISDGIGRYARCLLRALRSLDENHRLVLYDFADDRICRRPPALPLRRTGTAGGEEATALDVFHATGFSLPPPGPVPLVLTVHDVTFLTHPHWHTRANRIRASAAVLNAVSRGATVIAVSEYTRGQVEEHLGVPRERIEVIHEAPDPVFASAGRQRIGRRAGRPYVLAVGSLEPRKNLVGLLEGMMLLPAALRRSFELLVVGPSGWRNQAIRESLRRARRRFKVRVLGYLSTAELMELYREATLFAYPSLIEGFGLPVLEAMACGAPVLASKRSSLPEVAGDAALLVDPEDPTAIAEGLERLLDDPQLRAEFIERGFDNLRRFSWDRCARETVAVYRRAADHGR
jgi:glycosyltransferase involved in cell wall biosynthesis